MNDDEPEVKLRWPDLTPQARAAKATHLLMLRGEMSTGELAEELGYTDTHSIGHIMKNLSLAGVPVYQPGIGCWAILPAPF